MDHRSLDPQLDPGNWEDDSSESSFSDIDSLSPPRKRARLCGVVSHVRPGQKVHPDSAYVGTSMHDLAITAKPELEVLSAFIADEMIEDDDEEGYFTSYILDNFVIYRTPDVKPVMKEAIEGDLLAVQVLERGQKGQGEYELPSPVYISHGVKNLVFDGIVKSGDKREVLHCVSFETLSIGNIATLSTHNVNNQIWIQSHIGAKSSVPGGVWYELDHPAKEYEKHWEAFEWLALLVKYVSDALELCVERGEKVGLKYFLRDFAEQMRSIHGADPVFQRWIADFGKDDFRIPMATHAEFLWSQLHTADSIEKSLRRHLKQPVWGEILHSDLTAVKPAHPPGEARDRCVVTAYVASLFEWIFGEGIQMIEPQNTNDALNIDDKLKYLSPERKTQLPQFYTFHHEEYRTALFDRFTTCTTGPITVGDVVELRRYVDTRWKKSTESWYAFVSDTWVTPTGVGKLKILWLYWPEDVALCMSMKYPYSNELFFSDHCGCGKLITTDEVLRKVAVEFFCIDGKLKDPTAEFFVRQKYFSTADDVHVATLTLQDLSPETPCLCDPDENLPIYQCGDFVLIKEQDRLQPYRFEFCEENRAWVRKLERRREGEETGKVNELVWTETAIDVSPRRIMRKCHVVRIQEGEEIPRLADWSGSSDWFFYRVRKEITQGDDAKEKEVEEIADFDDDILIQYYIDGHEGTIAGTYDSATVTTEPESLDTQIPESISPQNVQNHVQMDSMEGDSNVPEDKKLRGLDLFCGGGNFGRGVADGGAVLHKWLYPLMMALTIRAIDINVNAIHTYKANLEHDDVNLYFGSINNFLFDVITGRGGKLPRPGDIDFILAGSPCRGFSNANPQGHEALKSRRNSALVCTTISAIDFYRPKYAILENVPAMAADRKYRNEPVNVSNQIMCALIGMGYQCRCLHLDALHFGSPQSRIRLFIQIAAPGCVLPEVPPGSHAHPLDVKNRAVGCKFAERDFDTLTAFPPVKLQDVWDDLPNIGNGHLDVCIPYPDHKTSSTANARDRQLISYIPHSESSVPDSDSRCPDYTYALDRGLIPDHLQLRFVPFKATDRRFQRLSPQGFARTVTCVATAQNRISGNVLHYREDRVMSILEAKRLQGFFDTDVLIGKPESAFRIIGNSVCRQVAFALGGKLAEAVRKGLVVERLQQPLTVRNVSKLDELKAPSSTKFMVLIEKREKTNKFDTNINREKDKCTTRDLNDGIA